MCKHFLLAVSPCLRLWAMAAKIISEQDVYSITMNKKGYFLVHINYIFTKRSATVKILLNNESTITDMS
jgi:hypothetical protein